MILLDTDILLRYARTRTRTSPRRIQVTALHACGEVLCVVPQNIYEFWAVATRPAAANGLGLSVPECQVEGDITPARKQVRLPSLKRPQSQAGQFTGV